MTCELCQKRWMTGNKRSHSNIKTKKHQQANVQSRRMLVAGRRKKVNVCTSCIKSGRLESVAS